MSRLLLPGAGAVLLVCLVVALGYWLTPTSRFTLSLPLDCALGSECFIQQYPDRDSGSGAADYTCGKQSYDGHDGTDIRARNMLAVASGIPVVAAAAGKVKGVRDGMGDHIVLDDARRAAIRGKECGNGVVIDHGDGWETQYCHLREGSIAVRRGQDVRQGDELGMLGSSGMSQFPHLEFLVRKDGTTIDPFTGTTAQTGCGNGGTPLWTDAARLALDYQRGAIVTAGFATEIVGAAQADAAVRQPQRTSPALVAYGLAINLEAGDVIAVSLEGPDGRMAGERSEPLERRKARYVYSVGKRNTGEGFPAGRYTATVTIERDGETVMSKTSSLTL